jgi:GNAT superfamily N-acetyltransferase
MEKTEIRKAVSEDLPVVLELWTELMDFHKDIDPLFTRSAQAADNFLKYIGESMEKDDSELFVAEVSGKLVGYVMANVSKYPPVFVQEKYGMISDAAVTASFRRRGTGEALVAAAADWFREKGISRMEMRMLNANSVSGAFWEKMGFLPYMTTLFKDIRTGME